MESVKVIGVVTKSLTDDWSFNTGDKQYSNDVCCAIDELLEETWDGDKIEITIRRLN